jgi:hypothetical protein
MINSKNINVTEIENSEIIKHTLISLIIVASSKTSNDYAWSIIKKLLGELKSNYTFLNFIEIADISSINYSIEDISISSDFDKLKPKQVGMAIQDLIDLFKKYLGIKAGYFFIDEFKNILGDKYYDLIKKIGVDLRLIELQKELSGLKIKSYKIRETTDSNIAFVEKVK